MNQKPNSLIHSTSPYLLQHAYNPVDWQEWGPEALARSAQEDKPILVSIGYSACHWCHVMERESFESQSIAAIMNENFICIKVDREERPDVDQVYMEAVQAMGIHGGWPLNVFLNPKRQPFFGGTYFPPQQWTNVLHQISAAFKQKRKEVDGSASAISEHLNTSDLLRFAKTEPAVFGRKDLDKMISIIESRLDKKWGGLEKAPKFVMPTIWLFLLRCHHLTQREEPLQWVTHTLTKMSEAGLYDQLGGGFSRYSVDGEWFAPHFEKMLYDNAQLLSLYSEAYALTNDSLFKIVVEETIAWLEREMTGPTGGFFSALDADSEGMEGKFYTWTWEETAALLGESSSFATHFGFTPEGNWEHGRNILNRGERDIQSGPASEMKAMRKAREARVRPGLDDKYLSGWNAMTIVGLTDAFRAFGNEKFLRLAETNMGFMEETLIHNDRLYRSYRKKRSATEGFLEDYAFLVQAYTALYQCTFQQKYLSAAEKWTNYTIENFYDAAEGYFHFTGRGSEPLIARKKEVFDNVIPGSNSVMARNLFRLGMLLDKPEWKALAETMLSRLHAIVTSEPGDTSNWGILMTELLAGLTEIAIIGPSAEEKRRTMASHFLPFALFVGATGTSDLPLLANRLSKDGRTMIHVCFDKTCQLPTESAEEALNQLRK